LIAIDLPGFGHSQQRDTLLSPRTMSELIVRLADAFGLENPHAVGPDIGTAAFLFAAAFQPERFRSVVVGSGGAAVPLDLGSRLKDWVEAPDLEAYRRTDPRQLVSGCDRSRLRTRRLRRDASLADGDQSSPAAVPG